MPKHTKQRKNTQHKPVRRSHFLFLELTSPPPFYQPKLSEAQRQQYDKWFIGTRSQAYYLKRFASFDAAGRLGARWHWAAFFITLPWLLYRKRYLDALVYVVAGWSFIQLNITLVLLAAEFVLLPFLPHAWHMPVRGAFAVVVWLIYSAVVACWADAYYYRMARREIADVVCGNYHDTEAQAFLAREGGVSILGMAVAFALFIFALTVVKQQFLPLYAKQRESVILFSAYEAATQTKNRAQSIYARTGTCPSLPITTTVKSSKLATFELSIAARAAGTPPSSQCTVVATITQVHFPNRSLNGRNILLHLGDDGRWHCTSSLNKSQTPKRCNFND